MSKTIVIQIITFLFGVFATDCVAMDKDRRMARIAPQRPRYEIRVNFAEFSVLNSAAQLGVGRYGGAADFAVRLARDGNDVMWTVTIKNPRLIEVMEHWMAQKTAELVSLLDFDNLEIGNRLALQTAQSVNEKIAYARANPIWDPVKIAGKLDKNKEQWFIESEHGKYKITGDKVREIKALKDKPVVATGFIKVRDQIELTHIIEKKQNTLELFVMSMCPFSKRAQTSIIKFLDAHSGNSKPTLEVHYIFYKKSKDGKTVYTSLHGEQEIKENLIQIIIRDVYPKLYYQYLLARSYSEKPWDRLALEAGITKEEIKSIRNMIKDERESLIENEYEYVTGRYQIYDGSPTFIWESEPVKDIRKIESFEGLEFGASMCAEKD